ncbi:hypothetical protein T484DRAFT_3482038, partial [Baffinella frigidus]
QAAALSKGGTADAVVSALREEHSEGATTLGIVAQGTVVKSVTRGSPAAATFSRGQTLAAGDTLAALGSRKLDALSVDAALNKGPLGEKVVLKMKSAGGKKYEVSLRRTDAARVRAAERVALLAELVLETKRAGQDPTLQQLLELVKSANLVTQRDCELLDARGAHVEALEAALSHAQVEASAAQRAAGQTIMAMQERMGALLLGGAQSEGGAAGGGEREDQNGGGKPGKAAVAESVKGSMIAAYNKARLFDEDAGQDSPSKLRAQVERLEKECAALHQASKEEATPRDGGCESPSSPHMHAPHETGWLRESLEAAENKLSDAQRSNGVLTRTIKGLEREIAELREGHAMSFASPSPQRMSSSLNWLLGTSASSAAPPSPPPASPGDTGYAGSVGGGAGAKGNASHRALDDLSKRVVLLEKRLEDASEKEGAFEHHALQMRSVQQVLEAQIAAMGRDLSHSKEEVGELQEQLKSARNNGQEKEPAAKLREQLDTSEASRRQLERDLKTLQRDLAVLAERDDAPRNQEEGRGRADSGEEASVEAEEEGGRVRGVHRALAEAREALEEKSGEVMRLEEECSEQQHRLEDRRQQISEVQEAAAADLARVVNDMNELHRGVLAGLHQRVAHEVAAREDLHREVEGREEYMAKQVSRERSDFAEKLAQLERLVQTAREEGSESTARFRREAREASQDLRVAQGELEEAVEEMDSARLGQKHMAATLEAEQARFAGDLRASYERVATLEADLAETRDILSSAQELIAAVARAARAEVGADERLPEVIADAETLRRTTAEDLRRTKAELKQVEATLGIQLDALAADADAKMEAQDAAAKQTISEARALAHRAEAALRASYERVATLEADLTETRDILSSAQELIAAVGRAARAEVGADDRLPEVIADAETLRRTMADDLRRTKAELKQVEATLRMQLDGLTSEAGAKMEAQDAAAKQTVSEVRALAQRAEAALRAEVASLRPQLLAANDTVANLEEELRERALQVDQGALALRRATEAEAASHARADRSQHTAAVLEEEAMLVRKQLELAQASAAEAQSRLAGMDSRLAGALAERDGLTGRMAQSQDVVDMAGASVASLENNLREQRAVLVQRERECQSLAARVGALEKANADLVSGLRKGAADAEATRRAADHARNALVLERDSARSQVERAEKDSGRLRDALNAQARELAELESLATRTHEHAESEGRMNQYLQKLAGHAKEEAVKAEQREARSKKELLTVLSTQWTGGASRPLSAAHPRNSTGWQARDSAGGGNPRRPVTSSTLRSSSGEAIVWAHGETPSWSGGFLDPHTGGWEELGRPNGAHARQSLSRDSRDRGRAPSVAPGGSIGAGGARDSNKGGERSKSVVFRMEEELVRDGTLENAGRNRKTNPRVQDPPQQHPIRDAPAQEEGLFSALDRFAGSIGSIDFGKW